MVTPNKTIAELSQWAADPEKMARFEQLVKLTQRTALIKNLLELNDQDKVIRMQIRAVCAKNNIPYKISRGSGLGVFEAVTSHQRYVLSYLVISFFSTAHGGIGQSISGLTAERFVDRLIYCYNRYSSLTIRGLEAGDMNFEMFVGVVKATMAGNTDILSCDNCGSGFLSFRITNSILCPICTVHKHAQVPLPARVIASPGQRRSA